MKKWFTNEKICWKLMKVCATQVMLATIFFSLSMAHDNYGQLLERKVTISMHEVSLQEALYRLEQATAVKMFYSLDQLQPEGKVSVDAKDESLQTVLDAMLKPYQITYTVREKELVIILKKLRMADGPPPDNDSISEPINTPAATQGKVTDAPTSLPLAGVNVLVKGTTTGTTTDAQGMYTLEADANAVLIFSFIGYKTIEERVGERSTINIVLETDLASLNEVVINAGYWDVNKREATGNIAKVTAADIQKQPVSNPLSALEGRMPGVYINETSGIAGSEMKIQIRGQNSLRNTSSNNGNLPFYVVDGVPYTSTSLNSDFLSLINGNPLISINPSDIESIEVLKDADATAIYGSRGANGVILITTKKGRAGKTKVDVTFSQGMGKVARKIELLNTEQYLEMRNEGFSNDNAAIGSTDYDINGTWSKDRYTDWQKELIGGTAMQTNAQASVSGGNANTQYLVGGSFFNQTNVFPGNTGMKRGGIRMELNNTSDNKKFNVSFSASYNLNKTTQNSDFTFLAMTLAPNAPALRNEDGNLNWQNSTWANPLAQLEVKYLNNTRNLITTSSLRYTVLPGLNIKANLGYNLLETDELSTTPISASDPAVQSATKGYSIFGTGSNHTWSLEPQAEYKRNIGRGELTALLGSTFQASNTERQSLYASGYTSDALLRNILAAPSISVLAYDYAQYKYSAIFSRLNYNYNEKYILNLTARRDGSSRFGPGKQFANFGAVGAAWLFSNEDAIKNALSFISLGKLRASYGASGSDAISNYQYLSSYATTTYPYNGVTGLTVSRLQNTDYSWESNLKFETAIELGFFHDHLFISGVFYRNISRNQLVGLPLPVLTGQSSIQYNLPAKIENRGFELEVNSVNIKTEHLQWTTGMNITIPRNILLEFPNLSSFPTYTNTLEVGRSLYTPKKYESLGVNPATGVYTFSDQNRDGAISSPADLVSTKPVTQKFYGGFSNTFRYRGFQLDVFLQFVNQLGNSYQTSFGRPGLSMSNQPVYVMSRWQKPGDETDVQRFSRNNQASSTAYSNFSTSSDGIFVDASFIRLKNISLSWQLPAAVLNPDYIASGKIFISGQNLITWTSYKGLDPETRIAQTLPPLKMITAGLQLTF